MAAKPIRKPVIVQSDARRIALDWYKRGILPVPVEPGNKKPIGKSWQNQRLTPKTIPQVFKPRDNVGGLWGKPSNDHVDVDLDTPISVRIAKHFLPKTFMYGRKGNPASHYIYKCPGAENLRCRLKSEGMVIELRGTGNQSVLPPSLHPSGERYRIEQDIAVHEISYRMLRRYIYEVGAATAFVANYPEEGGRHDYVHAVTGALMHSGWSDEHVTKFMLAILDCVSNKEDDLKQREVTIENTIKKFHSGGQIQGWPTLEAWISRPEISQIRAWLDVWKNFDTIKKPPTQIVERVERAMTEGLPDIGKVPGLVGDIARWQSKRSYRNQPAFDLAVGLVCTALATQNRYLTDRWDTPLQPYFLLLAPTSGGKESAMNAVQYFARKTGLLDFTFQGFQSYHAMLDKLSTPPHMACWLWDEAARKLKSAGKGHGGPDFQVITWLLDLYGKGNQYVSGVPGRKNTIGPIDHPFLVVMAAAQPQQMMEAISSVDLGTGLLSRFVLFDTGAEQPEVNAERTDLFPAKIVETVDLIRKQSVGTPTGFLPVHFDNISTIKMFDEFVTETGAYSWSGGSGEIWGRANQNALIVSGLIAVGVDPKKPMITQSIAEWGIDFVRWSTTRLSDRIEKGASRSRIEADSKRIEEIVRTAKTYASCASTRAQQKLLEHGHMPRSVLMRATRHITARDLDEILKHLIEAGVIHNGESSNNEVYWPCS